ncbi:glutamate--tRNA ligase [Devosia sp. 63-57]|uniref:glutamate--tRNA ligase n=1 Tax=Devosia sp. 63-57 TaxID=1895751 RepID=UPI00086C2484|nr:glutamate--tRNA ligase [Devosia sp. 63-57]ODT47337.1 MAG: glutamate--tRNA ligase [Pelagibacterium sp. SCN 63-126]ODU87014.1 MAG: glutamate--tRNA ligase [Pelagibacterium sp. SCN 63-17]OJX42955.1 MAG: glutamate--tRNA ligase [Devosia sp. 63-57]
MSVIVRWAPSPTGRIHLGNARPALLNWFFARRHGGKYVLRMDDTDLARSTRDFADGIEEDLAWLGVTPDFLVRQSERTALYDAARDRLIAAGRLYPCYETEEELDRKRARARLLGKPPIYDRAALALTDEDRARLEAEGRKPHWRFRLDGRPVQFADLIKGAQTVNTGSMSDPVLIRADGSYLYTLPSVVDDIDLGITHVIRGEDHVSNTGTQIEIFEALGGMVPTFAHHNLLTDAQGQGFSKRLGSQSIADFRAEGYEPLAIAIMATLTGTSLPIEPYDGLDAIAAVLDFSMISHGAARFDPAELDGLNARLLHTMPYAAAAPRLSALGLEGEAMWLLLRENLARFVDIAEWAKLLTGPIEPVVAPEDAEFIALAKALLPPEPWDDTTWGHWTNALKTATGRKGKTLFLPLRMALTGRHDGPELKSLLVLLGRKASLDRLP